jgi:hypothetical protein
VKIFAVFVLVLAGLVPTHADTITQISGLNVGNDAISGFIKDYAFVDVELVNPNVALVIFLTSVVGGFPYLVGGVDAVDINVNADSWSIGNIQGINAGTGFTPGPFTDGGSGKVAGFGGFNQRVDSFGGFTHSSHVVSFVLTNTSGTWSSPENVLVANGDGFDAAAHIFVPNSRSNASDGALVTGFAAESVPDPPSDAALVATAVDVPEPPLSWLLLTALLLMGLSKWAQMNLRNLSKCQRSEAGHAHD